MYILRKVADKYSNLVNFYKDNWKYIITETSIYY